MQKNAIIIIGLGNPGADYAGTRHNFGADFVQHAGRARNAGFKSHTSGTRIATTEIEGKKIILAVLSSLMNESGPASLGLVSFFKVIPQNLVLVYDDIDLPFGSLRISKNTSSGGHNGVQSVIDSLGDAGFTRLRLGIGPKYGDAANFVLTRWTSKEKKLISGILSSADSCLETYIASGLSKAASKFN